MTTVETTRNEATNQETVQTNLNERGSNMENSNQINETRTVADSVTEREEQMENQDYLLNGSKQNNANEGTPNNGDTMQDNNDADDIKKDKRRKYKGDKPHGIIFNLEEDHFDGLKSYNRAVNRVSKRGDWLKKEYTRLSGIIADSVSDVETKSESNEKVAKVTIKNERKGIRKK